tara:strand:+ start:1255 stop:1422 length:168 start_codon:yes stop_codon:yes gene_type:complete
MNNKLLHEQATLLNIKMHAAIKLATHQDLLEEAATIYAAADMALKEFERKHGGAE